MNLSNSPKFRIILRYFFALYLTAVHMSSFAHTYVCVLLSFDLWMRDETDFTALHSLSRLPIFPSYNFIFLMHRNKLS